MADENPAPPSNDEVPELAALTSVLAVFQRLAPEARERLLQTIATFRNQYVIDSCSIQPEYSPRSPHPQLDLLFQKIVQFHRRNLCGRKRRALTLSALPASPTT